VVALGNAQLVEKPVFKIHPATQAFSSKRIAAPRRSFSADRRAVNAGASSSSTARGTRGRLWS
jgi:hypothetical protein